MGTEFDPNEAERANEDYIRNLLGQISGAEVVLRAAKNVVDAYPDIKVPAEEYFSSENDLHRHMQHLIALVKVYEEEFGEIPKSTSEITD